MGRCLADASKPVKTSGHSDVVEVNTAHADQFQQLILIYATTSVYCMCHLTIPFIVPIRVRVSWWVPRDLLTCLPEVRM